MLLLDSLDYINIFSSVEKTILLCW